MIRSWSSTFGETEQGSETKLVELETYQRTKDKATMTTLESGTNN